MIKCILHGGETGRPNEHNKAFYQSWVKDFKDDYTPTILLIYFARKEQEWPQLEEQDSQRFANYTNNRKVNFIVADKQPDKLRAQIKSADVIYVRGGSEGDAVTALSPLKHDLLGLLDGKLYVGSSAGVMVVAHYTGSTNNYWKQGLGLLPINSIVHWNEGLREEFESFKASHNNGYEWLLIPETEFVIKSYAV